MPDSRSSVSGVGFAMAVQMPVHPGGGESGLPMARWPMPVAREGAVERALAYIANSEAYLAWPYSMTRVAAVNHFCAYALVGV